MAVLPLASPPVLSHIKFHGFPPFTFFFRLLKGKGWNQCFAMNGLVMTAQIHKPTFSMRSTFHRSPLGAPLHQQSEPLQLSVAMRFSVWEL